MSEMKEIEVVGSISDIISKLEEWHSFCNINQETWFRGQPDYSYKLIPNLFRNNYNESGMYEEFIRRYPDHSSSHKNVFEWLTLMQHYGLPTRLLDSRNGNDLIMTKDRKFKDYKIEAEAWITLANGEYYPDILPDACRLYEPVLVEFGRLLKSAHSSTSLFMSIMEDTPNQWMRTQLCRVFRKYFSPATPVEMLKKKSDAAKICEKFGDGFRNIVEVQKRFCLRPIPDEPLCAILWEYKDRGKKGYDLTERLFELLRGYHPNLHVIGPERAGKDVLMGKVFKDYSKPDRPVDFVIYENKKVLAIGLARYDSDRGGAVSVHSPLGARASRPLKWWPRWPRSQDKGRGSERLRGAQEDDRTGQYREVAQEIISYTDSHKMSHVKVIFVNDGPGLLLGSMWNDYAYIEDQCPGRVKVVTLRMVPERITAKWLRS